MRRKRKKRKNRLTLIIIIGIILFTGSFLNTYNANPFNSNENDESFNILQWVKKSKNRSNILVFGVDSANNASKNTRSDSIMLVSIDPDKENPAVISIPRDTRVQIPGRNNYTKINHAHSYGGPELLVETVEHLLNIDVDYYIGINYNVVAEVVDTLGGVEIDVPIDMKYSDPYSDPPLNIDIKKGLQVLTGDEAVQFMRFRKGYATQDLGRINAQQEFLKALVDQAISPATVLKAPKLLNIIYDNINTDMSKSKMISLGLTSMFIETENLSTTTLGGVPKNINGISYYVTSDDDIKELKKIYLNDKNISFNVNIQVLNGCAVNGIAGLYSDKLEEFGFNIYKVGNYKENSAETSFVEYKKDYKKEAEYIKEKLGIDKLVEKSNNEEVDINIVIGKDLDK